MGRTRKSPRPASVFSRLARFMALATGKPATFAAASAIVVIWAVSGPLFGFSDTWQLVINTGTTVITFLMVFLIQNTQNQDSAAVQVKLDEIITSLGGARNATLDMENMHPKDLEKALGDYEKVAKRARNNGDAAPRRNSGASRPSDAKRQSTRK